MRSTWEHIIQTGCMEHYPNVSILVCIKLTMATNTACCERGFSKMKIIKTYLRNRLHISTLDALMEVSMNGPEPHTSLSNKNGEEAF